MDMDYSMDCDVKKSVLKEGEMFFDGFVGRLWELCPWDKTHYVRKRDMEEHLEGCKKSFIKSTRKVECPFNPLHLVNRMEISNHIMTCENRTVVTNCLLDFEPKRETIEGVKMEPLNVALKKTNEWGEDNNNVPRGYDPMEMTKFRLIPRPPPPGMSKKQKKEWRRKEEKRFEALGCTTRQKPVRNAPYPLPCQPEGVRAPSRLNSAAKTDADLMDLITGLGSANIADPRDAAMKRINARLQLVRALETRLKEEQEALRAEVEQYMATIGKVDEKPDIAILNINIQTTSENRDPRIIGNSANHDPRKSRVENRS